MINNIHTVVATLPPRLLVHGQEGVGKTSLAAKFPTPVFLQLEDGTPAGLSSPRSGCSLRSSTRAALPRRRSVLHSI